MSFISNADHFTLGEGVYNNIHGNLIFHSHGRKRHQQEICDAPDSVELLEPMRKRPRGFAEDAKDVHGFKVLRNKHLELTREIGSGPGYFLHAGRAKGRAVIIKVFNAGPTVREQLEATVALSKGLMHPNVLRIQGVSAAASFTHFITYENAHWKMAEGPLAAALKDDLTRSVTLGFRMIAGLASGMNHLAVQGVSLASMRPQDFDILLDVDDRFLICANQRVPEVAPKEDVEMEDKDKDTKTWTVFNALCQTVLRSANRILHEEDIPRNPPILSLKRRPPILRASSKSKSPSDSASASTPLSPQHSSKTEPSRREYVWHTIERGQQSLSSVAHRLALDLDIKSIDSVNKISWTDALSPHRCVGYMREEVTLAPTTDDSAVVSHDVPSHREICAICHEVVSGYELFSCICGNPNPGLRPTVKCRECKRWSHVDCVGKSREFTCNFCALEQHGNTHHTTDSTLSQEFEIFSLFRGAGYNHSDNSRVEEFPYTADLNAKRIRVPYDKEEIKPPQLDTTHGVDMIDMVIDPDITHSTKILPITAAGEAPMTPAKGTPVDHARRAAWGGWAVAGRGE
ncbi:hypothetical protein C8R43DRAFT_1038328 [Mycena crocata]|nr:hypothetical protein C8R43DRAFT_1038328 [Mycena crocata]